MRILVITDVLWRNDNGVGNSYSNIFDGMPGVEIANICCQEGKSDNTVSSRCFQMSEARLLANLRNSSVPTGIVEMTENSAEKDISHSSASNPFRALKRSRLQILFWSRDLIWKVGHWKSPELKRFIDGFAPDVIFAQLQDKVYLNHIIEFVQAYTNKPLVLYVWDDVYSLKQFSLSPLFWLDRLKRRTSIQNLVKKCRLLYTISAEQQYEYAKSLKVKTALLYKGKNFKEFPARQPVKNGIFQILYTGNLYSGRYKTILKIGRKLEEYNQQGLKAQLHIYSGTDLSDKQIQRLNIGKSSFFEGKVPEKKVQQLQRSADILLHIEPISLKGSLLCRLSFSTKLVDYFYNAKCIFAVGNKRCASMKYLKRYDAAVTATSIEEATCKIAELLSSPSLEWEYSEKAWNCGYINHQIEDIQSRVLQDLKRLVNGESLYNEHFMDHK